MSKAFKKEMVEDEPAPIKASSLSADEEILEQVRMAVAAAEVAVGLAILTMIYRNIGTVDIDALNKLKW